MPLQQQIDIVADTAINLRKSHKAYIKSSNTCLNHTGPYTGRGAGSTVYANMEKHGKAYRDLLDQLKQFTKLI